MNQSNSLSAVPPLSSLSPMFSIPASLCFSHPEEFFSRLRQALSTLGYAKVDGLIDSNIIETARNRVLTVLHEDFDCLAADDQTGGNSSDFRFLQGKIKAGEEKGKLLSGYRPLTHHQDLRNLYECPALLAFFSGFFGDSPESLDSRWLRVMGQGESTGLHADVYRFQENAETLFTMWIPLGNYDKKHGTLVVGEKTHEIFEARQAAFGPLFPTSPEEREEELPEDFITRKQLISWASADFRMGDCVLFDIRTLHGSTSNETECFRISTDTRWRPRNRGEKREENRNKQREEGE